MRELGSMSPEAHEEVLDLLATKQLHHAFLVGENFEPFVNKYTFINYFPDTETLIEYLKKNKVTTSFILIKGSRGNKLERIVEYL